MFLAKDFIQTAEGLVFAVVENELEDDKVLCFLRYIRVGSAWKKVSTAEANQFLLTHHPQYLYFSEPRQAHLHAVSKVDVEVHHQPLKKLSELYQLSPVDSVEIDLKSIVCLLIQNGIDLSDIGITGSLLISAQGKDSDMDLVFYDRQVFHKARNIVKSLIQQGHCQALDAIEWERSFRRRDCDLTLAEYIWHEQRKYNKVLINERKVDFSFVDTAQSVSKLDSHYTKLDQVVFKTCVIDDRYSFDYPAVYIVNDDSIQSIVCYTATYTGQAKNNEWVEVSGIVEVSTEGYRRIVVGSSREAHGEYIKVIDQ